MGGKIQPCQKGTLVFPQKLKAAMDGLARLAKTVSVSRFV
jgi:hypothetical protein